MKKWAWIALTAAIIVGCSQPEGAYTIKGNLKGLSDLQVFLVVDNQIIDSAEVRGGRFEFRGRVEQPQQGILLSESKIPFALVFLEPGKLRVANGIPGIEVSGSALNEKYYGFGRQLFVLRERYAHTDDPAEKAGIFTRIDSMRVSFVENNLNNLAGLNAFISEQLPSMDASQIKSTIARFSPKMQQTSLMNYVLEQLAGAAKASVGSSFTDVEMADRNGKTITLSEVVEGNKYVLLDFWASWCGPCMRELPYLKSAYKRFRAKGFEIYGVTLDSDKDKWINAMDENKMIWPNVGKFDMPGNPAAGAYGVRSIPSSFLISGDGTIVARDLRGEALENKLSELLR